MTPNYQALVSEQAAMLSVPALPVVTDERDSASTDGARIFLGPQFMHNVFAAGGEGGVRFVLAHELGHTAIGMGLGGPTAELEADRIAARSVAALGFDLDAIAGVMSLLPSQQSESHPGSGQRMASATVEFNDVATKNAIESERELRHQRFEGQVPAVDRPDRNRNIREHAI